MSERKHPHFTPNAVIEWMKPDRTYKTSEIAKRFGVAQQYAWDMTKTLLRTGDIEHVSSKVTDDTKKRVYLWAKKIRPDAPNTSVAGPGIPPDLKAVMSGYDADIHRRVELCLMVRAR